MTINRRDLLKGLAASAVVVPVLKASAEEPEFIVAAPKSSNKPIDLGSEVVIDLAECVDYDIETSKSYYVPNAGSGTMDNTPMHFLDTGTFMSISIVAPDAYSPLSDHLIEHGDIHVINSNPDFGVKIDATLIVSQVSFSAAGRDAPIIMEIQGKLAYG